MKLTRILGGTVAALLLAVGSHAAIAGSDAPAVDLGHIKKLAGDWYAVGEDGKPTDQLISKIRSTAGGSAVLEILFPGTDHEMVTVYTMKGKTLSLTHYCVMGNQPEMELQSGATEATWVFDFVGGCDPKEQHMHTGTYKWDGADRLETAWDAQMDGQVVHTAGFDLVRVKKTGAR